MWNIFVFWIYSTHWLQGAFLCFTIIRHPYESPIVKNAGEPQTACRPYHNYPEPMHFILKVYFSPEH